MLAWTCDAALDELPLPVAMPAALAFGLVPASAHEQLANLLFGAEQALRLAAMPGLLQLLELPVDGDTLVRRRARRVLEERLRDLHAPTFQSWVNAFFGVAKYVTAKELEVVPWLDLDDARSQLRRFRGPPHPRFADRAAPDADLAAPEALRLLRNGLSHGAPPPLAVVEDLLHAYRPFLAAILDATAVLRRTTWKALDTAAGGGARRALRLTGYRGPTIEQLDPEDEWTEVLARPPHVAFDSGDGEVRSVRFLAGLRPSPLGIFDGWFAPRRAGTCGDATPAIRVVYLGMPGGRTDEPLEDPALAQRLCTLDVVGGVSAAETSLHAVASPARHASEEELSGLIGDVYHRDLFVPRRTEDAAYRTFLGSDRPALLVAGPPGAGKSAWACQHALRAMQETTTSSTGSDGGGPVVVFIRCRGVAVADGSLARRLSRRLGIRDDAFPDLASLVARLAPTADTGGPHRLLVVIDAVNEAEHPEAVFDEVVSLARAAVGASWLRIVVTVREEMLALLVQREGGAEASRWSDARELFFGATSPVKRAQSGLQPADVPVLRIGALTASEVRDAYERRRARGGCQTPFVDLEDQTRSLLTTPLHCRLFHEAFAGRGADDVDAPGAVFRAYVDKVRRDHGAGLGAALTAVVDRCIAVGREYLTVEDEHLLRAAWAQGRSIAEARAHLSPVESLVVAGILRREPVGAEPRAAFRAEVVLEYLVALRWSRLEGEMTADALMRAIEVARSSGAGRLAERAASFVVESWLVTGRLEPWVELLLHTPATGGVWVGAFQAWGRLRSMAPETPDAPRGKALVEAVAALAARMSPRSFALVAWQVGRVVRASHARSAHEAVDAFATRVAARASSETGSALISGVLVGETFLELARSLAAHQRADLVVTAYSAAHVALSRALRGRADDQNHRAQALLFEAIEGLDAHGHVGVLPEAPHPQLDPAFIAAQACLGLVDDDRLDVARLFRLRMGPEDAAGWTAAFELIGLGASVVAARVHDGEHCVAALASLSGALRALEERERAASARFPRRAITHLKCLAALRDLDVRATLLELAVPWLLDDTDAILGADASADELAARFLASARVARSDEASGTHANGMWRVSRSFLGGGSGSVPRFIHDLPRSAREELSDSWLLIDDFSGAPSFRTLLSEHLGAVLGAADAPAIAVLEALAWCVDAGIDAISIDAGMERLLRDGERALVAGTSLDAVARHLAIVARSSVAVFRRLVPLIAATHERIFDARLDYYSRLATSPDAVQTLDSLRGARAGVLGSAWLRIREAAMAGALGPAWEQSTVEDEGLDEPSLPCLEDYYEQFWRSHHDLPRLVTDIGIPHFDPDDLCYCGTDALDSRCVLSGSPAECAAPTSVVGADEWAPMALGMQRVHTALAHGGRLAALCAVTQSLALLGWMRVTAVAALPWAIAASISGGATLGRDVELQLRLAGDALWGVVDEAWVFDPAGETSPTLVVSALAHRAALALQRILHDEKAARMPGRVVSSLVKALTDPAEGSVPAEDVGAMLERQGLELATLPARSEAIDTAHCRPVDSLSVFASVELLVELLVAVSESGIAVAGERARALCASWLATHADDSEDRRWVIGQLARLCAPAPDGGSGTPN